MKVLSCTVKNEILTAELDVSEIFNWTKRNGFQCTTKLVVPVYEVFWQKENRFFFKVEHLPKNFENMFGHKCDAFRQSLNSFLKDHYSGTN